MTDISILLASRCLSSHRMITRVSFPSGLTTVNKHSMVVLNKALGTEYKFSFDSKGAKELVALTMLSLSLPAGAADWGYEGEAERPAPKRMTGASSSGANNSASDHLKKSGLVNSEQDRALRATAEAIIAKPESGRAGPGSGLPVRPGDIAGQTNISQPGVGKKLAVASPHGSTPAAMQLPPDPPVAPVKTAAELKEELHKKAVDCWMQFLMGMSPNPLSDEQKSRFKKYLQAKVELGGQPELEMLALTEFWNQFVGALAGQPERADAYAQLLRSLLRLRARQDKTPILGEASGITCDREMINELLGPERLAEPGEPPLAEDAINSYADMACFIYEKRHAGKTIDGQDNRALFASVITQKFKNAPSPKDKLAMASFDLIWAKFKILYLGANTQTQTLMVDSLMKEGAGKAASLTKETMLELILSAWPWR